MQQRFLLQVLLFAQHVSGHHYVKSCAGTFFHLNRSNIWSIWCDFDRASSLICGNKMPTRCNRGFYCRSYCLLNMFRGTNMPIIRSSRVLYSGCCLWYFVLWFSRCWSGVELMVMCPVCNLYPVGILFLHARKDVWWNSVSCLYRTPDD